MKKPTRLLTIAVIFVILCLMTALTFGQDVSDQPHRVAPQPQCVRIFVEDNGKKDSQGSGTYIAPLLVVTCDHVVKDRKTSRCVVLFPTWEHIPATVIEVIKVPDIAILKLDRAPNGIKPIRFAALIEGRPLAVQGYGRGIWLQQWGTLSANVYTRESAEGVVVQYREVGGAEARNGDSGGPIFNVEGKYVGTLWGADNDGTYFTPAKLVLEIAGIKAPLVHPDFILRDSNEDYRLQLAPSTRTTKTGR